MRIIKIKRIIKKEFIKNIVESLKRGEVIVFPTDTVYGLVCDAKNKRAVNRLFKIKKRDKRKAIPLFVNNIKEAKKIAYINSNQERILKKHWPGKFTFIFKRRNNYKNSLLFGGKKTIALRIPNHQLLNNVFKNPLTGTSANISGMPHSTKINDILKQFRKSKYKPDLVLDCGNLKYSKPSQIIDLTKKKIIIIRK